MKAFIGSGNSPVLRIIRSITEEFSICCSVKTELDFALYMLLLLIFAIAIDKEFLSVAVFNKFLSLINSLFSFTSRAKVFGLIGGCCC